MLVLSRKKGERIVINDDITVVVLEIRDSSVRLGFEANPGIRILRQEVYDRLKPDEGQSDS